MGLTETQQHLFNYFKTVHSSSQRDANDFYSQLQQPTGKNSISQNLLQDIDSINRMIKNYDLEIIEFVDEITCEKLFILINTIHDEVTEKAKFHDKHTTQYYAEIVKDCIGSETGCLTETHCLNLSSRAGLSKTSSQNALDIFIRDKWLTSKNGTVTLGMRAIAELQHSIRQLYADDVKHCPLCKHFIMQGFNCNNCSARYHFACLRKLKNHRPRMACSECDEDFENLPRQVTQGDDEESDEFSEEQPTQSTSQPAKRKKIV